jgi:purine-binding chemotaxis protein CheW
MSTEAAAAAAQYLTFRVASQEFGCRLLDVREILQVAPISPVPSTPACIRGVMNVRGSVLPVVDLSIKLGRAETAFTRFTCVVVLELPIEGERTPIGILAEKVDEVVDLLPGDVEVPPPFGMGVRVEFLEGLGKVGTAFIPLLDMRRVLSSAELLAAASAEPPPEALAPAAPTPAGDAA